MKTLKDFDYDLWTTEENGIKKYYVRAKSTREVTEVDAGVMRLLRSEEKKMRRYIKEQNILGTPLSLDSHTDETVEGTWLADSYDLNEDVQTAIMEDDFNYSLSPLQRAVYEYCIKNNGSPSAFADDKGITKQAVSNTLRKIRKKAKDFFV